MALNTTGKLFASTKTYTHAQGLSCCFRQWRAPSHCRFIHGYSIQVLIEFLSEELDENNWVVDFGSMKPIKAWLESKFDHKMLVALDDPELDTLTMLEHKGLAEIIRVESAGCEAFACLIFNHVNHWLGGQEILVSRGVKLGRVEVREHEGNSAICYNKELFDNE